MSLHACFSICWMIEVMPSVPHSKAPLAEEHLLLLQKEIQLRSKNTTIREVKPFLLKHLNDNMKSTKVPLGASCHFGHFSPLHFNNQAPMEGFSQGSPVAQGQWACFLGEVQAWRKAEHIMAVQDPVLSRSFSNESDYLLFGKALKLWRKFLSKNPQHIVQSWNNCPSGWLAHIRFTFGKKALPL